MKTRHDPGCGVARAIRSSAGRGPLHVVGGVLLTLVALLPGAVDGQLSSQAQVNGSAAPRVLVECIGEIPCSLDHFRTGIHWINWIEGAQAHDVHVTVAGGLGEDGASEVSLDFVGQGRMAHLSDHLTYVAAPTDGAEDTLEGIIRSLRLGLMRFAVEAGLGTDFAVAFTPQAPLQVSAAGAAGGGAGPESTQPVDDPWNYWTFRVGLSGNMSIQESRSSHRINPSFNADRVTEDWKLNFSVSGNLQREKIELSSGTRRNDRDNWNTSTLLVRSLGPHFSTGMDLSAGNSIQNNRRARVTVAPGFEWNYYPYVEASRRQLIAHYAVGAQYNDYYEVTVFEVTHETIPVHKFGVQYRQSEGWGNAGVSIDASQYLHDPALYSFGASGNVSFRIVRGLEVSLNASGEKINDQIHVPLGDLSDEDVLLGRQALPTGYSYQGSIGFSYRWGSSFSNIVNTRFPSVSGGGPGGGGFGGGPGPGGGGGRGEF